jgi:hypothetical protein
MQTGYTEYGGCRCVPLKSADVLTCDWVLSLHLSILFDAYAVVRLIE